MSSPYDEAIDVLKEVLDNFFSGAVDLKNVLRRCQHICEILGWTEQRTYFQNELLGYPSGAELPWYRRAIKGRIEWLLSAAQSGYVESTGRKSSKYISFRHKNVETGEAKVYDKSVFQTVLTHIENLLFNFASKSYTTIRYGEALQEIWQGYRTKVDEHLMSIGFGGHLDTIRTGLNSNNPQDWRAVLWSCRDVLCDMAAYLWQDPRGTYEYLPGRGEDGKLRVTQKEYVNRLGAYLHQKGVTGETGAYLRAEMERIYNSIQTLSELDNKAHGVVTLNDARTGAIGTYFILGELVTRTDMKPIMQYQSP